MTFLIDMICFLLIPLACWRLTRGAVPMAVLPILMGLTVAIAADRFSFDKSTFGPSWLGGTIGWIGVLILAFSAGLETRTNEQSAEQATSASNRRIFATALTAIALPFAVGFAIALSGVMDAVLARPEGVSPFLSAGTIGLCLAVSALPVLVGIVRELPDADHPLGHVALRIAALDDGILWIGLALLLFLHGQESAPKFGIAAAQVAAIGIFAAMAALRGRLATALPDHGLVAGAMGVLYISTGAWATHMLGLHELLGAYFAGVLAPVRLAQQLRPDVMGRIALFGLSPFFFAHRGLSIDGAVVTAAALGTALVLLLLAATSKLLAVHLCPPDPHMPGTERTRLGVLLQCKGLMEIVAATILAQAGLITATVFAILVTLALVSTALTMPLFRIASRRRNPTTKAETH